MKLVLDSNVIIAAFATRGLCHELLELCLSEHQIILSKPILKECRNKFTFKLKLPELLVDEIEEHLFQSSQLVVPIPLDHPVCRDPQDDMVIGTALAGQAKVIVTGDKDLLEIKKSFGIKILSPREFWELLGSRDV